MAALRAQPYTPREHAPKETLGRMTAESATPHMPESVPPKKAASASAIVLAIVCVAGVAELAYMLVNFSAMPVYLKFKMGYGESSITIIGTAFLLCEGLMKGPFGGLGDRVGRKWLIISGPLIGVGTSLLTLAVPPDKWYLFIALRILDGLGAAALWPAALAMIADVVPENRRSQAMSLFNVTYLLGVALAPIIGGAANDLYGTYRASFYVVSAIFLAATVVALCLIPDVRPHHETSPGAEAGFSMKALIASLRQIPETLVMAFVTFLGIGLIMMIVKLFALAEFKITETGYGKLLIVPALVVACASVPLGTLGDRIGKARAVRWGIGICALSMWALILIRSQVGVVLGGSLIGVGFVIAFPAWMALISASCEPNQRGAVMGAVGTAQGLGAMLGAPIGGYLYEHAHIRIASLPWINSHYAPFIGCAFLLLVAWTLAILTIKEPQKTCS